MFKYTVKRLLQSLVTILAIVTIVFLLLRMLPKEYYFTEDEIQKLSAQEIHDRLELAGLNDPVVVQLFRYYGQLFRLDFGTSRRLKAGTPVMELVASRFGMSMKFGMMATVISMIIGISMGILQTRHKDRLADHVGTAYTIFVNAVPHLVSYSLILILGQKVLHLPSMYSTRNPGPSSILPLICLCIGPIASYALWTRRYMVDELNKDYIKLSRIKGLSSKQIMVRHVLKNAFVPMVAFVPANFIMTIGGSLLVERFFSIPGMGPLLTDAIGRYDTNVVQALVFIYASLGILSVFLGDVCMMIFDPRITLASKEGSR